MKKVQRFDSVKFKAKIDEHGFLVDRPIVARIGLQVYKTPYGERREFRPASEVFKSDSLESFTGKPVTIGHVTVTPENAKQVVVGACAGAGIPNGIGVEVPLSIYDKDAIKSAKTKRTPELSVGYTSVDIDEAGYGCNETGEYIFIKDMKADEQPPEGWVKFDALQTNIVVNHIAMVFRGRAGIAKLNLDSEQEFPYYDEELTNKGDSAMTVKIKLDGAVEFDVPKEVASHIEALKADVEAATAKADSMEAERDALQAKVDSMPEEIQKAVEQVKADAEAHAELVKVAGEVGIKTDGLDAKSIKVAYVKEVMGSDVSAKSDSYIETAFELARDSDKMAAQRLAINGGAEGKNDTADDVVLDPKARFNKI
ncbi:capsid and scaffold protein [Hafnia phage Pocis76]|uniref:Capsid and scaffold protein n=1 Tax=Hafnia phage Pocis76 TaxID=2831174 RepID=A0A8E7FN71_9CAUD|nr:capsid and scaffold protein [Hafnia phage Pocis76]